MISVALRGLAARKLRSLLTMVAIVLGVAMISGSLILTDTFQRATDEVFRAAYGETDAVISWKRAFETGGEESRAFAGDVLGQVNHLPEVGAAAGEIQDLIHLVGPDGAVLNTGPAPTFGWGFDMSQSFYPLVLEAGRWPAGEGEAAIDLNTAQKLGLAVGDTVRMVARGPVQSFSISGIATTENADRSLTPFFALFTVPEAQRVFGKEGMFDSLKVAAAEGVSQQELVERLEPILPQELQVQTGEEQAVADARDLAQVTTILRAVLLGFAGVALLVGALVIFNALSITVAQRVREFAVLRTLGASQRQVLLSVVIEAGVVGLLASVVGLFLGLALAQGLRMAFAGFGLELPPLETELAPLTVAASLLSGILTTLAAGLVPALRATRVPPIAAVREGASLPKSQFARVATPAGLTGLSLGAALIAGGLVLSDLALYPRLLLLGAGSLLLVLGLALLSPRLVGPLTRIIGLPGARLGGAPGELARANAGRFPGRTAATAGALLVGLALISFVAVLGQGLGGSIAGAIEEQVASDYVLTTANAFNPSAPAAAEALGAVPGAEVVAVRGVTAEVAGSRVTLTGVEFSRIDGAYRFQWTSGSDSLLASAGRRAALLEESFARDQGLVLGSRFTAVSEFGESLELEVAGIHRSSQLVATLGQVTVPLAAFDAAIRDPRDILAFVNVSGGASPQATQPLRAALEQFPGVELQTSAGYAARQQGFIDPLLMMLYALLAFSVLVSFFGIVNTLALSVYERTRELGLLRAVGMTAWQVRSMIALESLITALIGVLAGLGCGVLLGALVTVPLAGAGLTFGVPFASLLVFGLAGCLVGILAAVFPARRAARLEVLQALRCE